MAKPWEQYQAAPSKEIQTSTAFDPDAYLAMKQKDYLCIAESIAILWLPILLLGWYYKTKQLPPSGWRRSGAVISVLILLLGSFESISQASQGNLGFAIFVSILASTPWIFGYAAKWIIDGFRSSKEG